MTTEAQVNECSSDSAGKERVKRVRTGCVTCRKRKVKCDESKPTCDRCRFASIVCEGYREPSPPKIRVRRYKYSIEPSFFQARQITHAVSSSTPMNICPTPPQVLAQQMSLAGTRADRRSFEYFRLRAVEDISSYFDRIFWESFILQASHTEPSIWYAVLALSALHESYHVNSEIDNNARADTLKTLALKQYTKAVSFLVDGISSQQLRLTVVLVSCIIFIWIEFIQDNLDTALEHLKSGMRLLREGQNSKLTTCVDELIIQLFMRLHIQVIVNGHRSYASKANNALTFSIKPEVNPPTFKSLLEARIHLEAHLVDIFTFHRQTEDPLFLQDRSVNHPFPDSLSIEATCQTHGQHLKQWQAAIRQSLTQSFNVSTPREITALAQMELQCLLAADSLATATTASQMIYDERQHEYERILLLVEIIMKNSKAKVHVFSFDMGVLTALFYLVLKCRDSDLRSRAINLMRKAPPREGLWKRQSVIEFSEWKMRKETEGCQEADHMRKLPHHARVYAEGSTEKIIDGRRVIVIRYKRGSDTSHENLDFEEEVTTLDVGGLANMLGSS